MARLIAILVVALWPTLAAAQTLAGSQYATSNSTAPSVTYTATSGQFLFMLVTTNGVVTCTPPTGWTATPDGSLEVSGNFTHCAAYKVASGSESYTWTLSASATWTAAVVEFASFPTASLVTHASQAQNTTTPTSGTTGAASSGDLVLATLADGYENGDVSVPSGYSGITPTGAAKVHYGTSHAMMGALAWKTSAGGTEAGQWTLFDVHYAGAGAYVFRTGAAPAAPGAPLIGTAVAQNASASVSFSAPLSNNGAAITSYTATSSPGGVTNTGAGSPIVVSGLTNGVAYTFTVTATNSAGTGAASSASNSVTPFVPSDAIPSSRLATANWQAAGVTPNGGIPARATICATILAATYSDGAVDARAGIQSALDGCPLGQTVLLGAGLFRVENYIYLNRGVTLRGSGAGVTTLRNPNGAVYSSTSVDTANGNEIGVIIVGSSQFPHWLNTSLKTLTATAAQGATTVTLDTVAGLTVGQYVYLSEDHYTTASWVNKPLSSGVANGYQNYASDKVRWAKHKNIATDGVTSVTSNASTDRITTNVPHGLTSGVRVYFSGHTGTFSPSAATHIYRARDIISTTVFTLQPDSWDGSLVDITSGNTSGLIQSGRFTNGDNLTPGSAPDSLDNSALTWFSRGYGHVYGETKRITAINGLVVTFESPLMDTYRTSYGAQVAISDTVFVEDAGLEALTIERAASGSVKFLAAAKSWMKDVEIDDWYDPAIQFSLAYRIEVLNAYVHGAAWRFPGGASYALRWGNGASEVLVWNSIFVDSNKNMTANAGGAGSVIAYNYADDAMIENYQTWQEVGLNGSHFPGPHHMLFEGNYSHNADSDFTHGSSHVLTFARNWLTGQRTSYTDTDNARIIGLGFGSTDMSFVGNVLGRAGQMGAWTLNAGASFGSSKYVYKLGYDPTEFTQDADPNVTGTFIDGDNYNYLTPGIRTAATGAVPSSYFLSAKPSFFATCAWPWVDATAAIKTHELPAYSRYLAATPLDTTTDQCNIGDVVPPVTAPARLRIRGE